MVNKRYNVTCDLFAIPVEQDDSLLYAPRVGFICKANEDLINLIANIHNIRPEEFNPKQIEALELLEKGGVLNGSKEIAINNYSPGDYCPTAVTLFPTNQCNLRCIYCYASAGEHKSKKMDWHYAKSAIDAVIKNALKIKSNKIAVGFHGGGEPLYRWDFIKKVVQYAEEKSQKYDVKLSVYSATNGLLNEKQLEWITGHFSDLNISFDGLPQVQDYHRPLPNGEGSFNWIDKTFKYLDKKGFPYGIRSTFSDFNIDLMEESYDFIINNYNPRTIHFEPVFQCGRCKTGNDFNVNLEKFARLFQQLEKKHKNQKSRLTYSGSRLETFTNSFCGVSRDSFTITTDGYITSCFEITSLKDPKSERFFYGRIDEKGEILLDKVKREYLHNLTVENLDYCKDCFAKWHCAGDCVAKIGHNELNGERGHDRCLLNRKMLKDKLVSIVESNRSK